MHQPQQQEKVHHGTFISENVHFKKGGGGVNMIHDQLDVTSNSGTSKNGRSTSRKNYDGFSFHLLLNNIRL